MVTIAYGDFHTKNLNILLRSNYDMCTYLTSSAFYKEVLLSLYKLNTVNQSNTPIMI